MSRIVDNLVAFRVLYMLVTPFEETQAYKLGIIDKEGNNLIKSSKFTTGAQRDAYTYLHKLVFKLKWLINKVPGQESRLRNLVAAMWLIKEYYESDSKSMALIEEEFEDLLPKLDTVTLVEEELLVQEFLEVLSEDAVGGAPANAVGATGASVGLDQPFVRKKKRKFQEFVVNDDVYRRFSNGKSKYRKWAEYLNLEDDGQKAIYDWARKNPKGVLVLKNGKEMKAIRFNRNGGGNWNKLKRPNRQINNDIV
jgi:hypothetical protein